MLASSQSNSIKLLTTTTTTTTTTMNALTLNDNTNTRRKGKDKRTKRLSFKHRNGKKGQRTDDYFLDTTNKERNKQTKVRFDTHRREELPDAADQYLENLHFANFLGNSVILSPSETEYNTEATINLNLCDSVRIEPNVVYTVVGEEHDGMSYVEGDDDGEPYTGHYYFSDDDDYYYDEGAEREDYTEKVLHRGSWRIWHPASSSFVDSDDDDHSLL